MFSCPGRAHSLVLGVYNEVHPSAKAQLISVTCYNYGDVETRAAVDNEQICSFISLLDWIRDNMNDRDKKTLSYRNGNENDQCGFTLE